jgi:hypothetical protein
MLGLAGVHPAFAKGPSANDAPVPIEAIIVLTKGKPQASVVKMLRTRLPKEAAGIKTAKILVGQALKKAMKTSPEAAATKCEDVVCLAGLGRKVHAEKILIMRVTAAPPHGITVDFQLINAESGEVARTGKLDYAVADDIKTQLGEQLRSLFPPPPPPQPPPPPPGETDHPSSETGGPPAGPSAGDGSAPPRAPEP